MLRGAPGFPPGRSLAVAFGTCFTFFLQLRIADEFKDYEEDRRYRPYRPVQRGLVTLEELGILFVACAVLQLLLALWLEPKLIGLLLLTWAYLAAMSKEFFIADWLRCRPVLYILSHMIIMPLVDFYATSSDWLVASSRAPAGLIWFLLASYCNGLVIEVGRKIRSPMDEEAGVATYSALWGRPVAIAAWSVALIGTASFAMIVSIRLHSVFAVALIMAIALALAASVACRFLANPIARRGKSIETFSGLWTIVLYLALGFLPHLLHRGVR